MFAELIVLFAYLLSCASPINDTQFVVVETKFGLIKGFVSILSPPIKANRQFNSIDVFFGVPFSAPPLNELRFEKPLPPKPWHEVRPALKLKAACVPHARDECNECSEDCLYLNIFAPHQQQQQLHSHKSGAIRLSFFNSIDVFFGVPFSAPPLNELRFEKPLPPKPWHEVRPALKLKAACVPHARDECNECSEDCLYLNIFAPHQQQQQLHSHKNGNSTLRRPLFPVLVLIASGGFEIGSAAEFGNYTDLGLRYVSAGIVLVSIQYRLGVLGFASTGDTQMPGNFGLWDQFAALRFISENIAQFGGNPQDITLFGESSGAASASFLGLSPHSQGLFHKSIQASGSSMTAWAYNRRVIRETAKLAKVLQCEGNGSEGLKQCMKNKTVDELFDGFEIMGTTRQDVDYTLWKPHMDGDFLPMDIPDLIERAPPKPTIMGIADLESLIFTIGGRNTSVTLYAIPLDEMDVYDSWRFELFVRSFVAKSELLGDKLAAEIQQKIVQFYTKDKFVEDFGQPAYYFRRMALILSDLQFIVPAIWEASLKAQNGWPIYFYKNTYYNDAVFSEAVKKTFTTTTLAISLSKLDTVINFVKNGNSYCYWLPMSTKNHSSKFGHLLIDAPMPQMNPVMEEESRRAQFWTEMRLNYPTVDLVRGEFKNYV
uniref:Carboxylic ester hydrolase n=1 Tax=Globodera pallida TaxID=36090 RepID=A0A183BT20_GLOPA